jgi:pimeloyl-ACP methyl ester carboxylesterase
MNKTRILLLASMLSSTAAFADAPATPGAEFAVPHRLVDIGGRRLNLWCTGTGSPTVVFESPAGTAGWVWWAVQTRVAARTRACVHDRAGYGFSDPSPHPADARSAVDDLQDLLAAAGVAPPYLLVGNSFGGGAVQLFAWRHSSDVSGLVLVEPMHEDENERADAASHGKISEFEAEIVEFGNECAAQAEKGFEPKSTRVEDCVGGADPALPGALGATDLAQRLGATYWRTRQSERESLAIDRAQLRAARQSFGDMPVIVLARGVSPYLIPGKPQSEGNKAVEAANLALLTEVAHSSTRGEIRVVPDAGHAIQETRPDAVATAVDDLLAKVRR